MKQDNSAQKNQDTSALEGVKRNTDVLPICKKKILSNKSNIHEQQPKYKYQQQLL